MNLQKKIFHQDTNPAELDFLQYPLEGYKNLSTDLFLQKKKEKISKIIKEKNKNLLKDLFLQKKKRNNL